MGAPQGHLPRAESAQQLAPASAVERPARLESPDSRAPREWCEKLRRAGEGHSPYRKRAEKGRTSLFPICSPASEWPLPPGWEEGTARERESSPPQTKAQDQEEGGPPAPRQVPQGWGEPLQQASFLHPPRPEDKG